MCELKIVNSGITVAAPLRVLLGEDSGDQNGKPLGHCALYAVMEDRNQPFTNFELHYFGGMLNAFDQGNTQLVEGIVEFSAENLVQAYNDNDFKKVADVMPQYLIDVAVSVQKDILYEMNKAEFLTLEEHDLYTDWIKVSANPTCRLEETESMTEDHNYISGSYLISEVAFDLVSKVFNKLFLKH